MLMQISKMITNTRTMVMMIFKEGFRLLSSL